jgi:hypothetical protein
MNGLTMAIKNCPHYELPSSELALWLEEQGANLWWTVDGDPVLGGRLALPCPAEEMAVTLRVLNRPLLLADKGDKTEASGQMIRADDLNQLADSFTHFSLELGRNVTDRAFYLCWKGSDIDWLLVEDVQSTEDEARDARSQLEAR